MFYQVFSIRFHFTTLNSSRLSRLRSTANRPGSVCLWTGSSCLTFTTDWRRSVTSTRCGLKAASPSLNWPDVKGRHWRTPWARASSGRRGNTGTLQVFNKERGRLNISERTFTQVLYKSQGLLLEYFLFISTPLDFRGRWTFYCTFITSFFSYKTLRVHEISRFVTLDEEFIFCLFVCLSVSRIQVTVLKCLLTVWVRLDTCVVQQFDHRVAAEVWIVAHTRT